MQNGSGFDFSGLQTMLANMLQDGTNKDGSMTGMPGPAFFQGQAPTHANFFDPAANLPAMPMQNVMPGAPGAPEMPPTGPMGGRPMPGLPQRKPSPEQARAGSRPGSPPGLEDLLKGGMFKRLIGAARATAPGAGSMQFPGGIKGLFGG